MADNNYNHRCGLCYRRKGRVIFECERCGKHFCSACFKKTFGQEEFGRFLESASVFCPGCYGMEQVRDYMVFEDETSEQYPFSKRFEHLTTDEISKIVDICDKHFDTETIYASILSVIGPEK